MNIMGNKKEKHIEIINNESINIIGNKIQKPMEITNKEFINIIGNEKEKVILEKINNVCIERTLFSYGNESINIIGNKKEELILDKTNNESINIFLEIKKKSLQKYLKMNLYIF